MLRSALRWLRIDQNDQIAASSMCSCDVLTRSDRRPAGAGTHWTLGNVVAPEQGWTINFGQGIPRTHHELEKPGHRTAHELSRRRAADRNRSHRTLDSRKLWSSTARTAHSSRNALDAQQRSEAGNALGEKRGGW